MSARVEAPAKRGRFYPARFGLDVDSDDETGSTTGVPPQAVTLGLCSQAGTSLGLQQPLHSQGSGTSSLLLDEAHKPYSRDKQSAIPSPGCQPCEVAARGHQRVPFSQAAAFLSSTPGPSASVPAPALPTQGFGPSTGPYHARLQSFDGASVAAQEPASSAQGVKGGPGHLLESYAYPPAEHPDIAARSLRELEELLGADTRVGQGDAGAELDWSLLSEGNILARSTLDRYTQDGLGSLDGDQMPLEEDPSAALAEALGFKSEGSSQGSYDVLMHHRLLQERAWEGKARLATPPAVGSGSHPSCSPSYQPGLPTYTPLESASLGDGVPHRNATGAQELKADILHQHPVTADGRHLNALTRADSTAQASFQRQLAEEQHEQDHMLSLHPTLDHTNSLDASMGDAFNGQQHHQRHNAHLHALQTGTVGIGDSAEMAPQQLGLPCSSGRAQGQRPAGVPVVSVFPDGKVPVYSPQLQEANGCTGPKAASTHEAGTATQQYEKHEEPSLAQMEAAAAISQILAHRRGSPTVGHSAGNSAGLPCPPPSLHDHSTATASLARDATAWAGDAAFPAPAPSGKASQSATPRPFETHSGEGRTRPLPQAAGAAAGPLPRQASGAPSLSSSDSSLLWPRQTSGSSSTPASLLPSGVSELGGCYEAGRGAEEYPGQASGLKGVTIRSLIGSQGEAAQAARGHGPGTGTSTGVAGPRPEMDDKATSGSAVRQAALPCSPGQLEELRTADHLYLSPPVSSQGQGAVPGRTQRMLDQAFVQSLLSGGGGARAFGGEKSLLQSLVQGMGTAPGAAAAPVKQEYAPGRRAVHLHSRLLQSAQQQGTLQNHQQYQQQASQQHQPQGTLQHRQLSQQHQQSSQHHQQQGTLQHQQHQSSQQHQHQHQQASDQGPVDLLNPLPWILGSQQRRTGCIPAASRGKIGSSYITLSDALWKKGLTLGLERFLLPEGTSWRIPLHRPLSLPGPLALPGPLPSPGPLWGASDAVRHGGSLGALQDVPGAFPFQGQGLEAGGEASAQSGGTHSGGSGGAPPGQQRHAGGAGSHADDTPLGVTQRASPVLRPGPVGVQEEAAAAAAGAPGESGGLSLSQRLKSTLQTLHQNSNRQGHSSSTTTATLGNTAHGHCTKGARGVPLEQMLMLGTDMPPVFPGRGSPSLSWGLPERNIRARQEPLKVEAIDGSAAAEGHARLHSTGRPGTPQAAPGEGHGVPGGAPGASFQGELQGSLASGGPTGKDPRCSPGGSPQALGGGAGLSQSGSIGRSPLQRGGGGVVLGPGGGVAGAGSVSVSGGSEGWGGSGAGGAGARGEMGVRTSVLRKRLLRLVEVLDEGKSAPFLDLFKQLNPCAKAKGTAQERVLHYVLRALMHRFTGRGYDAFREPLKMNFIELREARIWYYTAFPTCPFVGITTAGTVIPKLLGHQYVHIIDLGQTMIPQWPAVIRLLACQPRCLSGAPLHFRFTYVDSTYLVAPGRNELKAVRAGPEVGRMLQRVAEAAGVRFSFELVDLDDDSWHLLYRVQRDPAAAVVVATPLELMFHFSDSEDNCHPRFQLFKWMRGLRPTVVPVVEIELEANRESLRSRVRRCFDFHTALFQAHDSTFQEEDKKKGRVFETCWHGRTICSMVACEGMQRIVRPVSLDGLAAHMQSLGFRSLPMSSKVVDVAQEMLESYPPNFGLLLNERGALQLCWESVPLVSASMWTTDEDRA